MAAAERKRILILSGTQLSANPRVVKEADTLAAAGYSVEVLGGLFQASMSAREAALHASKLWVYTMLVDAASSSFGRKAQWLRLRLRRRLSRELYARFGLSDGRQLGYLGPEMLALVMRRRPDLVIAHNPSGVWVAAQLRRRGVPCAVDMEDWYSEDVVPDEANHYPVHALREWEREALNGSVFSLTTSRVMSEALATAYKCNPPAVIYNSFPFGERANIDGLSLDRLDRSMPSICWFSQVVGPDRGLEQLVDAWGILDVRSQLHFRGNVGNAYRDSLIQRAPERYRCHMHFHPQVPHSQLLSRIAEHDIGLATEVAVSQSRLLTITNKLPFYLLAGLPVVASDTEGQKEAASLAPDSVFLFAGGNAPDLAQALSGLLGDAGLRRRAAVNAVTAAREVFSWEHSAAVLLASVAAALS